MIHTSLTVTAVTQGTWGYILAGLLALLVMGYLIYTLIRPDKF